ncbi:hypothetical protein BC938DRAFT_477604 [Jimgerdemannia flammicorona]|uniref:Uncharacterized protein n=1 Tax=Jimgerdemannia flammicorona TaxID=994334 RepID=A0A433P8S6_9FUNG|nr:hypothetical protein BC938DRAFT_477604 [Jimgerdemannia flammicorona]
MQDTRCVVYRNTSSSTVSTDNTTFTLPNFLCDPTSCTAYLPSDTTTVIIPPSTTTLLANDTNSVVATTTSSDTNIMTTTMIALIACCCVIFLGVFIWVSRILSRCFGWQGCLPTSFFARDRDRDRDDGTASQTSSLPTGQNAMADVAGRRTYHRNRWRAGDHDVRWDDNASVNTATTEPLPPYVSPDAPPPKYETALIMEITADRRRGEILGHDGAGLGGGGIVGTGNGVVDSIDVLGP